MSTPHRIDVVQRVAHERGDLLETNTYESCGEFVQHVLQALEAEDPGNWGHVGKTAGEGQCRFADGSMREVGGHRLTGFSHDVICYKPTGHQIDILGNASARSDPNPAIHGPARVVWHVIPPQHYRPNNPWLAPVPLRMPQPPPQPPPQKPTEHETVAPPPPEPAPVPCVVQVTAPQTLDASPEGTTLTLDVSASASTCEWVVLTSEPWLKAAGKGRGSGPSVVTIEANSAATSRSGEVALHAGGLQVHRTVVTQAGQPAPAPSRPWWHDLLGIVFRGRQQ